MNERTDGWKGWFRLGVYIGLFFVLALAGSILFSHIQNGRAYDRLKAAAHAAGEPFTCEELDAWYKTPPPEENGAAVILEAVAELTELSDEEERLPFLGTADPPPRGERPTPQMLKDIRAYLQTNEKAFAVLDGALGYTAFRYPADFSRGYEVPLDHLTKLRRFTYSLRLQSLAASSAGDAGTAQRAILKSLLLSRSLEKEPSLISQLVRIAVSSLAERSLETSLALKTSYSAEQLRTLRKAFRAAASSDGFYSGMVGERCTGNALFDLSPEEMEGWVGMDGLSASAFNTLYSVSGFKGKDRIFYCRFMAAVIARCRKPVEKRLSPRFADPPPFPSYALLSRMILPAIQKSLESSLRWISKSHLAQLALAVEEFRLKEGRLPKTAAELVPGILKAVPIDPFDGKPIRYLRVGEFYKVYSVGPDKTDNGGTVAPDTRMYEPGNDLLFTTEPESKP